MPKRKSADPEKDVERIYWKLKKLEEKLDRYRSSSPTSNRSEQTTHEVLESDEDQMSKKDEEQPREEAVVSEPGRSENQNEPVVVIENIETTTMEEELLDPEILNILGEDPSQEKDYGDNLQKDIASRWSHILINGLSKENKSDILKNYLPAPNCTNMKAPKLNLEIKAALTPLNLKKDLFSQAKQNQMSCALSAIGKVLKFAISSKLDQGVVKPLSDAGRVICDLHYRESISRRYAIINTLNKQSKDTIKNTKIDDFLFGGNLNDHLKSSKAISRSGLEMKGTVQRPPFKPVPGPSTSREPLNSRGMTRVPAGEPRQNPIPKKPVPARQDRRQNSDFRRNNYARQKTNRRQ